MPENPVERLRDFAIEHVATRPELHHSKDFPEDLWRALGSAGLLGVGLPEAWGGGGASFQVMAECCRTLSEAGGNLGVAMTWMAHNLNARLHLEGHGTEAQKALWLPPMARGDSTLSIAISEPGVGAHPKRLQCSARLEGGDYVLKGEKSYLTNGPLAGVFLVLAISGEAAGRKQFSAFLVPREAPGFVQTPGVEIDFLHPSPHCGIRLNDCRIPAANLLGEAGTAFERISLRMRAVEDALATAAQAGGYAYLLRALAASCRPDPGSEAMAELGRMSSLGGALARLAQSLAADLDAGLMQGAYLDPLSAGCREIAAQLQIRIDDFINEQRLAPGEAFALMRRDLIKSRGIAQSVHQAKAAGYGAALLKT